MVVEGDVLVNSFAQGSWIDILVEVDVFILQ